MASLADLHVDAQLSNVSVRYQNQSYIANALMPTVDVLKESDQFVLYGKDNLKNPSSVRANKAEANRHEYTILGRDTYACVEHALKDFVTDRDRAQSDDPLDPEMDITVHLTDLMLLEYEIAVATQVATAANYDTGHSTTLTGTSQWSDYANSDPIGDVRTGMTKVLSVTARMPNIGWMGQNTWDTLIDHPDVVARTKSVGKDPTMERVAQIFGLDRLLIGRAIKDVAPLNVIGTPAFVWGKDFGVMYNPPNPGIRTPAYGYTFQSRPFTVEKYAVPSRGKGGTAIEVSWIYDLQLVSLDNLTDADSIAGYVIKAATA